MREMKAAGAIIKSRHLNGESDRRLMTRMAGSLDSPAFSLDRFTKHHISRNIPRYEAMKSLLLFLLGTLLPLK